MLSYWAQKANNENAAYLQALAAEQAAAKGSGGGGGGGSKSSSGELSDKENESLAKKAQKYRQEHPDVYLDSRTLDNYLNSLGYNDLQANTFKAYLQQYGARYLRQPT